MGRPLAILCFYKTNRKNIIFDFGPRINGKNLFQIKKSLANLFLAPGVKRSF
jgi:hypothetical protein